MELTHTFTVPAPVDVTWAAFQDIESVAGCFPGATVTGVEGDDFTGACKVKLGPIALVYNGSGTFLEKDEAGKRFVVEAKGKDKRGNGTASATVAARLADADGSTQVTVVTDLAITGKTAQFGRGVMQDVSDKLLGQFVACLEQKVGSAGGADAGPRGAPDQMPEVVASPAASVAPAGGADPVVEPAGAESPPQDEPAPVTAVPGTAAGPAQRHEAPPQAGDALDLGRTVVPILAKAYWKQALIGLAVVVLVRWLARRHH